MWSSGDGDLQALVWKFTISVAKQRVRLWAQMVQRISPSMEIGPLDAPSCLVPVLAMAQVCVICLSPLLWT